MARSEVDIPALLPMDAIMQVKFYKRDEITTDLICCEVVAHGQTHFFHEELPFWPALIEYLSQLRGFEQYWFESVSQPPFAPCETIAFLR